MFDINYSECGKPNFTKPTRVFKITHYERILVVFGALRSQTSYWRIEGEHCSISKCRVYTKSDEGKSYKQFEFMRKLIQ